MKSRRDDDRVVSLGKGHHITLVGVRDVIHPTLRKRSPCHVCDDAGEDQLLIDKANANQDGSEADEGQSVAECLRVARGRRGIPLERPQRQRAPKQRAAHARPARAQKPRAQCRERARPPNRRNSRLPTRRFVQLINIGFEETPRFQRREQENENERHNPRTDDEPLRPHAIRHPRQSDGEYGRQTVAEKDSIEEQPALDHLAAEIGVFDEAQSDETDQRRNHAEGKRREAWGWPRIVSRHVSTKENPSEVVAKNPCSMRPEPCA